MARKSFWAMTILGALIGCTPYATPPDPPLDPTTIERTGRPNDYLICPQGGCAAVADARALILDLDTAGLYARWMDALTALPRVRIVDSRPDLGLVHAEQRSAVFRFVDTILVKVVPVGSGATFAAYSRSELGYGDMGVNRARIEALVTAVLGTKSEVLGK